MERFYEEKDVFKSDIDVLYYEFRMFNQIPLRADGDWAKDNAQIESFLLHARNLIEFLHCDGHLKCSSFKGKDNKFILPIKFISKDNIQKINEHLSHISSKRRRIKLGWKTKELKNEINKNFIEFLEKISPDYFLDGDISFSILNFTELVNRNKN